MTDNLLLQSHFREFNLPTAAADFSLDADHDVKSELSTLKAVIPADQVRETQSVLELLSYVLQNQPDAIANYLTNIHSYLERAGLQSSVAIRMDEPGALAVTTPSVSLASEVTVPDWLENAKGTIESFKDFEENWNSTGAERVLKENIELAKNVLSAISGEAPSEPFLSPSPHGGISMEFRSGTNVLLVIIESKKAFSFLFVGGEKIETLSSLQGVGYRAAIDQLITQLKYMTLHP